MLRWAAFVVAVGSAVVGFDLVAVVRLLQQVLQDLLVVPLALLGP